MLKKVLFVLCIVVSVAQAAPSRYFVILYGYENWRNAAAFSHTFAAFYEVGEDQTVHKAEISWLPQDGHMPGLRPLRMPALGYCPGQNLSIRETLERAVSAGRRIRYFGPFESSRELFELAIAREQQLESGALEYYGLDYFARPRAVNCVHAVSDIVGIFHTGLRRGPSASYGVAEHFFRHGYLASLVPQREWMSFLAPEALELGATE